MGNVTLVCGFCSISNKINHHRVNEYEMQVSLFDGFLSAEKEVYRVNALLRRGDAAVRNSSISYIFKELERLHIHVYMSNPGLHLSWMDLYE